MNRPLSILVCVVFIFNSLAAKSHSLDGSFSSYSQPSALTPLATDQNENELERGALKKNATVTTTTYGKGVPSIQRGNVVNNVPFWKQQLPFPLNNKTDTLRRIVIPTDDHRQSYYPPSSCEVEVFLLGTAHVSKDSSRDVRLLLESVKPDAIFLELCHQRLNLLEPPNEEDRAQQEQEKKGPESSNELKENGGFLSKLRGMLRRGKKSERSENKRVDTRSLSSIASSLLTNMQGDFADSLEVELGGEFVAAYQYWKNTVPRDFGNFRRVERKKNVHMILGDRPVSLTLTRGWESLRVWGKIKLLVGLLISSLRKPNPDELREWMDKILNGDSDLMSESVAELAKHFPTLAEVVLKERDAYMACKLQQTCWKLLRQHSVHHKSQRRYRLVAIVGAGHVEGITRWLTKGGSLKSLTTVPETTDSTLLSMRSGEAQLTPGSPADILSKLVQIKASIEKEDHDYLVHELTEVNPSFIDELDGEETR
ncbi:unnamed protein product [Pseudo-nitzschia multistriata]|uniref:TraB domain-containing protein n=1 Tax=Pseudo-nitzschia multistriata TaxID=183589 RepID=A0A448ZE53_9STRA|nr:unnamed protein product [Pseudo-nitzschia multistriata]VEU41769.1 unnamed protein product [Pseudo-nitzschia multistriata]